MNFLHDDFLLHSELARQLYHGVAAGLPIVDYHNHLDPGVIADDRSFHDLYALWIEPDPYKHRAMRIHGIPERGITGAEGNRAKYNNWAVTLPATWGNPLCHWNALELERTFGIDTPLTPGTADAIWERAAARLTEPELRPQAILAGFGVETLCTSDDLLDDLEPHRRATAAGRVTVRPSLRGDSITRVGREGFGDFVSRLGSATRHSIRDLESYLAAVDQRLDSLAASGCVLADHALDSGFRFVPASEAEVRRTFLRILSGDRPAKRDTDALAVHLLVELGRRYAARNWGLQLHVGAQRRTSARLRALAGGAGGYASIGSPAHMESLATLLDTIERGGGLPDVILYTLNPADNAAFASLTGSFSEDGTAGKVQFGPAWWYNDQFTGIRDHLETVASYGLLHHWIGMTTDSRSLLSFCRHEYFRRILCNLLAEWVAAGRLPAAGPWLDEALTNICHGNARRWIDTKKLSYVSNQVE